MAHSKSRSNEDGSQSTNYTQDIEEPLELCDFPNGKAPVLADSTHSHCISWVSNCRLEKPDMPAQLYIFSALNELFSYPRKPLPPVVTDKPKVDVSDKSVRLTGVEHMIEHVDEEPDKMLSVMLRQCVLMSAAVDSKTFVCSLLLQQVLNFG